MRRLLKEKRKPLHLETLHERSRNSNNLVQLEEELEREILEYLGFLPDHSLSIHLNARKVLGNTTTGC